MSYLRLKELPSSGACRFVTAPRFSGRAGPRAPAARWLPTHAGLEARIVQPPPRRRRLRTAGRRPLDALALDQDMAVVEQFAERLSNRRRFWNRIILAAGPIGATHAHDSVDERSNTQKDRKSVV